MSNLIKIGFANLYTVDKKSYNIVLTKLYDLINFQKIRYQIINNKIQLDDLKKSKFFITPHFQGHNYLLFLFMLNGIKHNILISKKELKYFKDQNNLNEIKMYQININNLDQCYYNGTILDGRIINGLNSKASYIIQDVYYLSAKNLLMVELSNKLDKLNDFINDLKINQEHNIECKISRLYDYSQLPDLLFNKLKMTELKINGLIFLPEYTGKSYIYTNDIEFEELKNKSYVSNNNNNNKRNASEMTFYMKKTNTPDVYELYENDINNLTKEGIAHIPNINTSHFYKEIFRDKNMVQVNCLKSEKFNKWIPLCDDYINYSDAIF